MARFACTPAAQPLKLLREPWSHHCNDDEAGPQSLKGEDQEVLLNSCSTSVSNTLGILIIQT